MGEVEVEILGAEPGADAELDAFFDACPTSFAQQTRHWRDVIVGMGADEPHFVVARRDGALVAVLPGYRFEGPLGAILTSVPQAGPLGGIACATGARARGVYQELLAAYLELACATGCALASLISNPIWPDRELYDNRAPDFTLENSCLVLDLAEALDPSGELVDPPSNLRRNLQRAQSGALRVDEEQSLANVEAFYEIHRTRHAEIGATPLPRELFMGALQHAVPAGAARFFFVRRRDDDEMVAGGFYLCHGQVVDALMPAVRSDTAHLSPNFLLAMHSIRWSAANGFRYYNWQASPPHGGVDRFKRQWGSRDRDYCYFTWVTGDAEAILRSDARTVSEGYPWHYVVPFDRLGASASAEAVSTRAAAWSARESGP